MITIDTCSTLGATSCCVEFSAATRSLGSMPFSIDSILKESLIQTSETKGCAGCSTLDDAFAYLMDHETILPYLIEFVDDKVRIDGAYSLVKLPGEGVPLHARPSSPRDGTGWYHVHGGQITSGLTGVEWALTPASAGGFCVVTGSHKANFEIPFQEMSSYAEDVPVSAGDVILFTEALTHGSRWHGPGSRRVLIYKYCPGTVVWLSDVWDEDNRASLTDRQRRMTMPPYVFDAKAREDRSRIET
jgi:hypothetical protein